MLLVASDDGVLADGLTGPPPERGNSRAATVFPSALLRDGVGGGAENVVAFRHGVLSFGLG